MATIKFYIVTDMRTFPGFNYQNQASGGGGSSSTNTTHRTQLDTGFYHYMEGTEFGNFFIFPGSGTATYYEFGIRTIIPNPLDPYAITPQDYPYWKFYEISVPIADLSTAINSNTLGAYMPTVLTGNDWVAGELGNDYLLGYAGNDILVGLGGNDTLDGGAGDDLIDGGDGVDAVSYATATAGVRVNLATAAAQNTLGSGTDTFVSIERLYGSAYKDSMTGSAAANLLKASAGNDYINGGAGNDSIYGEAGNDVLDGGLGNDLLSGSVGIDTFRFTTALGSSNVDTISGFVVADDVVQLDKTVFAALALGTLSAGTYYQGSAAHDADDRIIYNSANGNLYYDPDGNGAAAQTLFAKLGAGLALTNADFFVIA